jgi:hypothetical protein
MRDSNAHSQTPAQLQAAYLSCFLTSSNTSRFLNPHDSNVRPHAHQTYPEPMQFNVYLVCATRGCRVSKEPRISVATLSHILGASCVTCDGQLYPAAVQYRQVMIAMHNNLIASLTAMNELEILHQLELVVQQARSVAYHASELIAFRRCLYATRFPVPVQCTNQKQAAPPFLNTSVMPLVRQHRRRQPIYESARAFQHLSPLRFNHDHKPL